MNLLVFILIPALVSCQSLVHVGDPEDVDLEIEESNNDDSTVYNSEEFIPTNEWQVVKPGQHIPKGLHVRINMQTGVKEAKLLDPSETNDRIKETVIEDGRKLNPALEEALKNIATSRDEPSGNKEGQASKEAVKNKFRSIEEIQAEFSKKNLTISSEQEIIMRLLLEMKNSTDTITLLSILTDLEFYIHNIDNAQYFTDIGGLAHVVRLMNTSLDDQLVEHVALLLGSAAQSNEYVGKELLHQNAIPTLLRHIQTSSKDAVIKRAVFALSAIIRSYPTSFTTFVSNGGLEAFSLLVVKPEISFKVKVKIYTFLSDVLHAGSERYSEIRDALTTQKTAIGNLCNLLADVIDKNIDDDSLEKLLDFIKVSSVSFCTAFPVTLPEILVELEQKYTANIDDADFADYYNSMVDHIKSTKQLLIANSKDEL